MKTPIFDITKRKVVQYTYWQGAGANPFDYAHGHGTHVSGYYMMYISKFLI